MPGSCGCPARWLDEISTPQLTVFETLRSSARGDRLLQYYAARNWYVANDHVVPRPLDGTSVDHLVLSSVYRNASRVTAECASEVVRRRLNNLEADRIRRGRS